MNMNEPTPRQPLRLWPGVGLAVLTVLSGVVVPVFTPAYAMYGWMAAALLGVLIILWWLLFSRARWYERLAAVPLIFLAAYGAERVVHPSISGGAMGDFSAVLVMLLSILQLRPIMQAYWTLQRSERCGANST